MDHQAGEQKSKNFSLVTKPREKAWLEMKRRDGIKSSQFSDIVRILQMDITSSEGRGRASRRKNCIAE